MAWVSLACGYCGKEPAASSVRCQACLTKFCGSACQSSSSIKHKAECRDLACMAFARGIIAQRYHAQLGEDRQWALDMIALSWSMRGESKALYDTIVKAESTFRPPVQASGPDRSSDTQRVCLIYWKNLPRTIHLLALRLYLSHLDDGAGLVEAAKTLVPRAFDGFPEWPFKNAGSACEGDDPELGTRSFLLLVMAEFGSSRQALVIGYARMLPTIRQLERRGVCKDRAGILQLLRLKWAELLLLRAGDASSGEEKPGLIKEAASMVLTCMRELEALPRLVDYVEVRGPDSQPFMLNAASNLVVRASRVRAYVVCVRVGRWVLSYRKSDAMAIEPVVESLVVLQAVTEAEAVVKDALAGEECPVERGRILALYYSIAASGPSTHERALEAMAGALAALPPPPPPSSPPEDPLPPRTFESDEQVMCSLCQREHLSLQEVRRRLLVACGHVSDCLGRAEECDEYDRQTRQLCLNGRLTFTGAEEEIGRVWDSNFHVREGERCLREGKRGMVQWHVMQLRRTEAGPCTAVGAMSRSVSLYKGVTEGERSKLDDVVVAMLEESSKTQEEKKWRDALQEVRSKVKQPAASAKALTRAEDASGQVADLEAILPSLSISKARGKKKRGRKPRRRRSGKAGADEDSE